MIYSFTDKEITEIRCALDLAIEKYEDKSYTEEYDQNYEASSYWNMKALFCKILLEKI